MKKIFILLFFALVGLSNINAATFSSVASGTWSAPGTWTVTAGADTDNIPDSDDDVTINGGHTISLALTSNFVKNLTNNGSLIGNTKRLNLYGNFTNTGTGSGTMFFIQAPCIFSSSNTFSGCYSLWVNSTLTISAGTSISTPNTIAIYAGKSVVNHGSVYIAGGIIMNGNWTNQSNSSLTLNADITGTGILNATSVGNSVNYKNNKCTKIKATTYYNLNISAASTSTRIAQGNISVLNNFTLGAGTVNNFSLANFSLTIGGNWINSANKTILNQGPIIFNGSGTQSITRSSREVINNLILNGSGTVLLGTSLDVSQGLTVNSGTLDVSASNYTVNIAGNLINNSTINTRSGLFNFNGTVAQTVSGSSTNNFYNVASANAAGVSISSPAVISNILTVSSGAFGTSGAGSIRIPATGATTYGRIGAVGGSLTGTGWTIESYINGPAPKGWQWLSSPINGTTLADWDNDNRFYMSGVNGNDGNAGTFKSVRVYTESTGVYTNVTTTSFPLTACKGIQVWMADDNINGLTAPLIYNSVGTPNFGNQSIAITAGGAGSGYNLVGNPYACPITYSAVVAASGNLDASFIILQENGTYATDPNGGIISPNQGFMCAALAGGTINFTEACKNTTSLPNILKTAQKSNAVTFSVFNNINGLGGQTSIEFSENSTDIFEKNQDLSFLASPYDDADNIWSLASDKVSLLRNSMNNSDNEKHVPLIVKAGVFGIHTISAKGLSSLVEYNKVVLEDLSSGEKIDLLKNQNYNFNTEEIGKEYHFIVHFYKNEQTDLISTSTIQENTLDNNTSVYNTPSNVVVKFDMAEETDVQISVYNLSGQLVIEQMNAKVTNDRIALPLQKENGLYLLIIKSKDQQISRKIIY